MVDFAVCLSLWGPLLLHSSYPRETLSFLAQGFCYSRDTLLLWPSTVCDYHRAPWCCEIHQPLCQAHVLLLPTAWGLHWLLVLLSFADLVSIRGQINLLERWKLVGSLWDLRYPLHHLWSQYPMLTPPTSLVTTSSLGLSLFPDTYLFQRCYPWVFHMVSPIDLFVVLHWEFGKIQKPHRHSDSITQ